MKSLAKYLFFALFVSVLGSCGVDGQEEEIAPISIKSQGTTGGGSTDAGPK